MAEAFYSFGRIKIISRNNIKSAVATAAYHAGTKLTNVYDGITHDHSKKKYVGETYIRVPEGCPQSWRDETVPAKERLGEIWNTIELENGATNARLARSNYIALPHELTLEQGLECVDRFVKENCTELGMGCTYSVHDLPNNRHVDMMYFTSEYDGNGKPKSRAKKEYLCRNKNGEEMYMDAQTFKSSEGWEKVFKYEKDGERLDLTPSEAAEAGEGLSRINKYPVCRTVRVSGWDDMDLGNIWRKSWENILNDKFDELGLDLSVDCRSYEERGINQLPTVHEGWGINKRENQQKNIDIRNFNNELAKYEKASYKALENIANQIKDLSENQQTAKTLKDHERVYRHNVEPLEAFINSEIFPEQMAAELQQKLDALKPEFEKAIAAKWQIHNFKTNPHFEMFKFEPGEPAALRAWKERENEYRELYNKCIDELIAEGEITGKEAMAIKFCILEKQKALKKQKDAERESWIQQRDAYRERIEAERKYMYSLSKKSTIGLLFELALIVAGVDPITFHTGVKKVEPVAVKSRTFTKVYVDPKVQAMLDEIEAAAGRKTSEERRAERRKTDEREALNDVMKYAEEIRDKNGPNLNDKDKDRVNAPEDR